MALASAAVLFVVLVGSASAETYSVATTAQLEEAVKSANANCSANTIVLGGAVYSPPKALSFTDTCGPQTLEGPTHTPSAALDGANEEVEHPELLTVAEHVSLTMKNVVVQHAGFAPSSGVEVFGTLTVESSLLAGNHGASITVNPSGAATIRNSTLSDSSGGLVNDGTANFENSTVAFNKLGGIENAGSLELKNTIVAENGSPNCSGAAPSLSDHSLSSDSSCGAEKSAVNPLLSSLFNDGGSTSLHSLQPGSPAIDAGDPATCTTTDQRGQPRPDVAGTPCDIGADEYSQVPPIVTVPSEIVKTATSNEGAVVTYAASATSSVAVIRSFSCTPASGSKFPVGTTMVMCTAKDGHENTASASFNVTVKQPELEFKEWILTGSLTDHKVGLALFTLPEGSRFNGHAAIPGELEANTTVPEFKSTMTLFGLLPVTFGLTFNESGPVKGTIGPDPAHPGNELIKATASDTIGVTSFTVFGFTIPLSCQTAEPVSFPLETSEPLSQLTAKGATFSGETTLPPIRCNGMPGGLAVFGPVFTLLLSGQHNPFTLGIEP